MNELRRMEFQLDNAVFYQLTWDIKKKKTKILGRCRPLYFIYKRCFISSFLHFCFVQPVWRSSMDKQDEVV